MGRWGQRLFEGDMDLDIVSKISTEAGAELLQYEIDETDSNNYDKHIPPGFGRGDGSQRLGLEATRALLNDGRLVRMFEKYNTNEELFPSKEYYVVILGALAMGVGATITHEHMELLQNVHKKIPVAKGYTLPIFDLGFRADGAAQFQDALNEYKNDGTPWDFLTPGQTESLLRLAEENARNLKACKKCGKLKAELSKEKKKLKTCGKCKRVAYCSKECQKEDWKGHKKNCGPADAPNNTTNPRAPICLNQ